MTAIAAQVIVGANLAGGRAAETLRQQGFDGRIILIGAENDRPYERPPLSKGLLQGTVPVEKTFLREEAYYVEQAIELRLGVRATRLDPREQSVELDTGELIHYSRLLIATGSRVRRLPLPGGDLAGVHYLRTLAGAQRLAADLRRAPRLLVVGAGFIGLEVAATARSLGCDVTVLEAGPVPLQRALGAEMGAVCAAIHRDHGVHLRLACTLEELRGAGRVEQAVLAGGEALACDAVVIGVGVEPVTDWLAGSGIALDNGVLVNEYAETNIPHVYAAGDVANTWNPLMNARLRVEHYENAQNQGVAAARSMLGQRESYAPVPYFWSDQYDLTLEYIGHAPGGEQQVLRGNVDARSFIAFYLADGRVRAALGVGRPQEIKATRRLIRSGMPVTAAALADENLKLNTWTHQNQRA